MDRTLVLPPFVSLLILGVILPQLIGRLITDFEGGGLPMYLDFQTFILLLSFAVLGFGGMVVVILYALARLYRWWAGLHPVSRVKLWKPGDP